jgi:2-(3-amino-3-carboxypropyl)histidine synthase
VPCTGGAIMDPFWQGNGEKSDNVKSKQPELKEIIKDYTCDLTDLGSWLQKNRIRSLSLQLPEGLKRQALNLIDFFQNTYDLNVVLLGDPCYGACDIPGYKLDNLGIDGVIHFGHAKIPNISDNLRGKLPVYYVELKSKIDSTKLISQQKNLKVLNKEFSPPTTIGLVTNLQFISYINSFKKELENANYQVIIGAGDKRIEHIGQILGCNFSAAKKVQADVMGFLFIGDGIFHPLGISLATNKTVLAFDPVANTVQNIDSIKEKILRQRNGAIARGKECKTFGILVSFKPGQNRLDYANELLTKLSEYNKKGCIIIMDNISPQILDHLPFEGYINTACPRLTIDDYLMYKKPILTTTELEIMVGERSWENYIFDEIW